VVKQIIIGTMHGHPMPLIIEAARVSISHHNQPSFAEVFDGLRGA
jgi:chemotaxis protein MotA